MEMDTGLLINKTFEKTETGVKTEDFLKRIPSVKIVKFIDTTSSAGDWSGYIVQEIAQRYCLIPLYQENREHFEKGFAIYTEDVFSTFGDLSELEAQEELFIDAYY